MERKRGRVIVWSPPRVITRGSVFPFLAGPFLFASVAGARLRMELCPSSICWRAYVLSYLDPIIFRFVVYCLMNREV